MQPVQQTPCAKALAALAKGETKLQMENAIPAVMEALKINSTLTQLSFVRVSVDDVWYVSEVLKSNQTLKRLYLGSETEIDEDGAWYLAEALKSNSTLTELSLRTRPNAKNLFEGLKTSRSLTHLSLSGLGHNGAWNLAEALKTNRSLTHLFLEMLDDSRAFEYLPEALKTNSTLKYFALSCMEASGCAWRFFEALNTNSSLSRLHLTMGVDDEDARRVAEALKTNSTLTHVKLTAGYMPEDVDGEMNMGDAGAMHLSEVLKTNSTLTHLALFGFRISDDGARHMAEALKTNCSLKHLDLDSCRFQDKIIAHPRANGKLLFSIKTDLVLTLEVAEISDTLQVKLVSMNGEVTAALNMQRTASLAELHSEATRALKIRDDKAGGRPRKQADGDWPPQSSPETLEFFSDRLPGHSDMKLQLVLPDGRQLRDLPRDMHLEEILPREPFSKGCDSPDV